MNYKIYKFCFLTGVHFGEGMLNDSLFSFGSDVLFSALYIEALKMRIDKEFYQAVEQGTLCFSDAFPYIQKNYFLPKPIKPILVSVENNEIRSKEIKKVTHIPVRYMESYLKGKFDPGVASLDRLGFFYQQTRASVRREDDTLPYHVGVYNFYEGSGLYIIAGFADEKIEEMMDTLFYALELTGIGGKRSSGLGKFQWIPEKVDEQLFHMLRKTDGDCMLIASALPAESELEHSLEGATYLLKKRSGFVAPGDSVGADARKKDAFLFAAGSCFKRPFEGLILNVAAVSTHPVYRCAKAMFVGV